MVSWRVSSPCMELWHCSSPTCALWWIVRSLCRERTSRDPSPVAKREWSGEEVGGSAGSAPPKRDNSFGPPPVNLSGPRTVSRCTRCGTVLQGISTTGQCPKCGFELHSCKQCMYFDPGARFEC